MQMLLMVTRLIAARPWQPSSCRVHVALQVDWGQLGQTHNAQPAYQGRDMHAPVQQFAQPAHPQATISAPAYSADLGAQLDLLSGGLWDSATAPPVAASAPPAPVNMAASPAWESYHQPADMSCSWSMQGQPGVSQEAMERHALLPMPSSSSRFSRRDSQACPCPSLLSASHWRPPSGILMQLL